MSEVIQIPRIVPATFDTQELLFRIHSTAIIARGPGLKVFETQFSNRLARELRRIAEDGEHVAGLICEHRGALDRSSLRALNVYLRTMGSVSFVNRWDWAHFCRTLNLRFSF